jgi:hypothetical protein
VDHARHRHGAHRVRQLRARPRRRALPERRHCGIISGRGRGASRAAPSSAQSGGSGRLGGRRARSGRGLADGTGTILRAANTRPAAQAGRLAPHPPESYLVARGGGPGCHRSGRSRPAKR